MHEFGQLSGSFRQRHAMADEDHRLLGLQDMIDAKCDFIRRGAAALGAERRRRLGHLHVVFFLVHIERHVDIHRPRPSRQHGRGRLAQRQRQHVDARRLPAALDHRPDNVGKIRLEVLVDFLERAAVKLRGRDVRGDRQDGRGIGDGASERHHDVAGARPAGGQGRHRLVPHAEVGVRHVAGHLLVARRHHLDAVARAVEGIEHAHIAVAANPEHVGNLAIDQKFGDDIGTLHSRHMFPPVVLPALLRHVVRARSTLETCVFCGCDNARETLTISVPIRQYRNTRRLGDAGPAGQNRQSFVRDQRSDP